MPKSPSAVAPVSKCREEDGCGLVEVLRPSANAVKAGQLSLDNASEGVFGMVAPCV